MDESIVLLQGILCWPLVNMTYLSQNQRRSSDKVEMTLETRKILREYLWTDYMLYDHFNAIFEKKLRELAERQVTLLCLLCFIVDCTANPYGQTLVLLWYFASKCLY